MTVIDGATDRVIATVTAGNYPRALCYNPTNNKVYCANYGTARRDRDRRRDRQRRHDYRGRHRADCLCLESGSEPGLCRRTTVAPASRSCATRARESRKASSRKPQADKLAATVMRGLPPGAVAFDAMGRRVMNPRSGVLFRAGRPKLKPQASSSEEGSRTEIAGASARLLACFGRNLRHLRNLRIASLRAWRTWRLAGPATAGGGRWFRERPRSGGCRRRQMRRRSSATIRGWEGWCRRGYAPNG